MPTCGWVYADIYTAGSSVCTSGYSFNQLPIDIPFESLRKKLTIETLRCRPTNCPISRRLLLYSIEHFLLMPEPQVWLLLARINIYPNKADQLRGAINDIASIKTGLKEYQNALPEDKQLWPT